MATLCMEARQTAAPPQPADERPLLRFTTAGSVDDGKSTLIGRLLHDAGSVYDDHLDAVRASGVNRSSGPLDLSLLTDGLKAEREQGITIDVAYRHFATPRRRFLIADTPGHDQYTRNMATGASTADAAIILVDARRGLTRQSRRHAYIAWLLGIRHLIVAVNKMDLVHFEQEVFERIQAAWGELAGRLPGVRFHLLPVSALDGDNVVEPSQRMPWYAGMTLLELLETIDEPAWDTRAPLRFAVQYVIRPNLDFRGYAGRIDSGFVRVGDPVIVLPSGKQTYVERIVTFDGDLKEAHAPMAVTLMLADEGTTQVAARIKEIVHRIDPETMAFRPATQFLLNEIGLVQVETTRPLVFDRYRNKRQTGAFVLIDRIANATLAAGMIERGGLCE